MKRAVACAAVVVALTGCGPAFVPEPGPTGKPERPFPSTRFCARRDLVPSLALQGATGKLVGGATFRVRSRRACEVFPVPPKVALIGATQRTQTYAMAQVFSDPSRVPSLRGSQRLRRGDRLFMNLDWSNWCGRPATALVISIRHSGAFRLRVPDTPPCLAPRRPTRLGIGPVLPSR
jgi:hypothetical protein